MSMPPSERIGEDAIEPSGSRLLALRPWLLAAAAALVLGSQGPGAPSGPALLPGLLPTPTSSAAEGTLDVSSSPSPGITSVASPVAATPTVRQTSGDLALELGSIRSRL
jgi:hypothetical protein